MRPFVVSLDPMRCGGPPMKGEPVDALKDALSPPENEAHQTAENEDQSDRRFHAPSNCR